MKILAFESSCDETSASVVLAGDEGFTVKSNIIGTELSLHTIVFVSVSLGEIKISPGQSFTVTFCFTASTAPK